MAELKKNHTNGWVTIDLDTLNLLQLLAEQSITNATTKEQLFARLMIFEEIAAFLREKIEGDLPPELQELMKKLDE